MLIADEVYREFVYEGRRHRSVLTLAGMEQQVVVVDSVSKRYSLCGARIGNIVSRNRDFMAAIMRFGQARLCPPTVEQYACTALTEVPASYIAGVIAEYQKRRDVVFESLTAIPGVLVRKPEGAFYICARLPVDDANAFAEWLLRDFALDGETVMVAPADGFYATPGLGRDEVRIAYVLEEAKLRRRDELPHRGAGGVPGEGRGGGQGLSSAAHASDRPAECPAGRSCIGGSRPRPLTSPARSEAARRGSRATAPRTRRTRRLDTRAPGR